MAQVPSVCDFGWKAPSFSLPATDGKTYDLSDVSGPNGTLVMFICNHCPYVLSVLDRIIRDAHDLQAMGVGVAAISANDVVAYPQDSFENMGKMASTIVFLFPIYTMNHKMWRAPMTRPAPQTFLGLIGILNFSTGDVWMLRDETQAPWICAAIYLRR